MRVHSLTAELEGNPEARDEAIRRLSWGILLKTLSGFKARRAHASLIPQLEAAAEAVQGLPRAALATLGTETCTNGALLAVLGAGCGGSEIHCVFPIANQASLFPEDAGTRGEAARVWPLRAVVSRPPSRCSRPGLQAPVLGFRLPVSCVCDTQPPPPAGSDHAGPSPAAPHSSWCWTLSRSAGGRGTILTEGHSLPQLPRAPRGPQSLPVESLTCQGGASTAGTGLRPHPVQSSWASWKLPQEGRIPPCSEATRCPDLQACSSFKTAFGGHIRSAQGPPLFQC